MGAEPLLRTQVAEVTLAERIRSRVFHSASWQDLNTSQIRNEIFQGAAVLVATARRAREESVYAVVTNLVQGNPRLTDPLDEGRDQAGFVALRFPRVACLCKGSNELDQMVVELGLTRGSDA